MEIGNLSGCLSLPRHATPYLSAWFHVDRSFRAGLKIVNRRIASLPQDSLDALHHQIMNLRALIKGNLAQCFVNRCWKV
jgi:hypothetical protein